MATMNYHAYLITCLTNTHVGSGDAAYGLVDNLVQRDATTGYPTIHSSSLKGALREYFEEAQGWDKNSAKVRHIFGHPVKDHGDIFKAGVYRFLAADLVALPVRSNVEPYFLATSKDLLMNLKSRLNALGLSSEDSSLNALITQCDCDKGIHFSGHSEVIVEDATAKKANSTYQLPTGALNTIFRKTADTVLLPYSQMKDLTDSLPVIARNQLENGESKNLWYEEIVPRESRFVCFIVADDTHFEEFNQVLTSNIIQIGANASIGYGFCKFTKIS